MGRRRVGGRSRVGLNGGKTMPMGWGCRRGMEGGIWRGCGLGILRRGGVCEGRV